MLDAKNWVADYADYLFSIAMMKIGNREDAEDLVQEVFVSALKNLSNFRGDSSVKTWLTAILKNKVIDYYRKNKVEKPFSAYLKETEESFDNHFFDNSNFGRWINKISSNYISNQADKKILSDEFQQALENCLSKMPSKLKMVFVSKYIDEETTPEILRMYGITDNNFWTIIFRAKTLLRTCLEKKQFI